MNEIAIKVKNISKKYKINTSKKGYTTFRETINNVVAAPFNALSADRNGSVEKPLAKGGNFFWALKDISFEVKRGEVVGIIGHNGAGKSTLLKTLSRITEPSEGYIDIFGRVGSLLEVGTGFHPELSGRENIYLSGAIIGMRHAEIESKFDEIVEFAEVEKFIDTPVKHYSSGMYLRLAFAVAAHLDTEIMLIDEVLAVGDARFQNKCLGKMEDVAKKGRTVLFVSHNMAAVSNLCSRVIVLKDGQIWADGGSEIIGEYLNSVSEVNKINLQNRTDITAEKKTWLTDLHFADEQYNPVTMALTGQPLVITFQYSHRMPSGTPDVTITFYDTLGQAVASCDTRYSSNNDVYTSTLSGEINCVFPKLALLPGEYRINVLLHRNDEWLDHIVSAAKLNVSGGDFYGTGKLPTKPKHPRVLLEHHWDFKMPQVELSLNSEVAKIL